MPLDPSIILKAGDYKAPDLGDTLVQRERIKSLREVGATNAQTRARSDAKMSKLSEVVGFAKKGDFKGAESAALDSSDPDVWKAARELSAEHRALVERRISSAAPLAFKARQMPYELRRGFIAAGREKLLANDWTEDEVAGFDPSDERLDSILANGQKIADLFRQVDVEANNERADRESADRMDDRGMRRAETGRYHVQTDATRRRGQDMTAATQRRGQEARRSAPGNISPAPIATAPDGRKVQWDGKAWVLIG